MYHTSANSELNKAGQINSHGLFGSCLFFSDDVYAMSDKAVFVYEADFNCVRASDLHDNEIISTISEYFNVDDCEAEKLLDGSSSEWELEGTTGEDSWYLQQLRGECAVKMGYDGCENGDFSKITKIIYADWELENEKN